MKKGKRAGKSPISVHVLGSKQPFCDGSHKGTGFAPVKYLADQSKKVFFCTCKQTNDQPLCDGSHNVK